MVNKIPSSSANCFSAVIHKPKPEYLFLIPPSEPAWLTPITDLICSITMLLLSFMDPP